MGDDAGRWMARAKVQTYWSERASPATITVTTREEAEQQEGRRDERGRQGGELPAYAPAAEVGG